jgi:hypothetical protein
MTFNASDDRLKVSSGQNSLKFPNPYYSFDPIYIFLYSFDSTLCMPRRILTFSRFVRCDLFIARGRTNALRIGDFGVVRASENPNHDRGRSFFRIPANRLRRAWTY